MAVVLCPQGCSGLEGQNARALQHVVSHGVCHPPPAGGSPAPAPLPHSRVSASCAGFILNQLEGSHSSQHPEQTWRHPEAEGTAHVWGSCSEQPGRLSREQPPPPAARPSFSSHWPEQVTCSAENIQSLVRGQRGQTGPMRARLAGMVLPEGGQPGPCGGEARVGGVADGICLLGKRDTVVLRDMNHAFS